MGCCQPVLGPIENYYTKYQVDQMLEEIESAITSGCCITPEEVESAITSAMTIVESEIPSLSGYATEEWVINQNYITGVDLSDYATKEEIPSLSGYATEQWVENQGYLTEHQHLKTINGQSLVGDGDIEVGTGGTIDLSNYYTTAQTINLVESAVTVVEGEIPSLSGYATEQWVEDKHYITGVDLSDYALKSEIPTVPTSNTAFTNDAGYLNRGDLTEYATQQWVYNQGYITGVDLSNYATYDTLLDYATKTWVTNQNYITNSEVIQYITNLQQQIDSLKEQISGCCGSTGETLTRWITMTGENDYTCSGTTKMTKEKEQQSTDGGNTWTDTGNYRTGSTVLEENSTDCGYIEPQYRWKGAPQSDYMCSGTSKYYKVYYEVSYDGGTTWQHVQPEQTRRGSLIEADSTDCGYVPVSLSGQPLTFIAKEAGTFKLDGVAASYSVDSGTTWRHVDNVSTITIQAGQKVMWSAILDNCNRHTGTFTSTGAFDVEGNVMSVVWGRNDFLNHTGFSQYNYVVGGLFSGCTKLQSAEKMELPAKAVPLEGYKEMFKGCTSLTKPPRTLPAKTLGIRCYENMFSGCTSLTESPQLLATQEVSGCYDGMFKGCSSLTKIVCNSAYYTGNTADWVNGVAANGTFYKNPDNTEWSMNRGVNGVPVGWTITNIS